MNLPIQTPRGIRAVAMDQPHTRVSNQSAKQTRKPSAWMRFMLAFMLMLTSGAYAQNITVSGSLGSKDGTYASLTGAGTAPGAGGGVFAALNSVAQTGATITVSITGDVTEPGTNNLNAGAWTSITISPSGGATRTISGTVAGNPLITLNGADNVTFNGLNTGGNALTITNLSTASTSGTSTIKFITDATNNTITNCTVLGSSTTAVGTNGGTFWFAAAAASVGNDNNTISNCNIGPNGSSLPTKHFYGNGSTGSTALGNSGISITGNNIFDYFGAATTSAAIYTAAGCNGWSITNNNFYQTGTRTWTTGANHMVMDINNATATSGAQGFTITGNIIGYASNTQTGVYTLTGTGSSAKFIGIHLNGITGGTISNVNNNTVAAVSMTGVTASGTTSSSPFQPIYIENGLANTNNNTIGSQSATGSLVFSTTTTSATDIFGIHNFSVDNAVTNSNNIGGISITNAGASGTFLVYGIRVNTSTSKTWSATSNLIGGTVANSIQLTATGTSSQLVGAFTNNAGATLTSNTVRNLTSNIGTGTTSNASVIGISLTSSTLNNAVSQNTIFNLSNTNATAASVVTGIQFTGSTAGSVTRNNIYGLSVSSTSNTAEINGIRVAGGTTTYANNMIALGGSVTNANIINGIVEPSGTDNFYHNSVYIGGSPTAGTGNSFAFNSTVTTNTRNFRNNIFVNARNNSGATGKNYAVQVGGTAPNPAGLTINYNVYNVSGTGGVFGRFNSLDVASLGAWKTGVGQDANSINADPQFADPTNSTPDLHIGVSPTPVEGSGVLIGTVTDDFDGQTRSGLTPTDIGADAGNFTAAPSMVYVSSTATQVTASGCAGANRVQILRMEVVTTGALNPLTLTSLTINGNGTSNFADLAAFRIFYTGTSNVFSNSNPINAATAGLTASDVVVLPTTGTVTLAEGTNYFWLAYNLNTTVTGPDLDGEFTNVVLSTGGGTPTVTAPAGVASAFALPTVVVSPTSGTFCSPGGTAVALAASGATSYAWLPATGLDAATGANVNASPSATTTYTVTGTDGNGCTNTATSAITVAANPTGVTATATPSTICSGATATLNGTGFVPFNASQYGFAANTGASLDPMTGAATVIASNTSSGGTGDDTPSGLLSLGFTFYYEGVAYTQYSISPDGFIRLGTAATSQFTNAVTSSTNTPKIYPLWDDLATGSNGNAKALVTGTAPNRIFIAQWFLTIPRNLTGSANSTFQVWLYETSNVIEFRYGTVVAPGSGNSGASAGITGVTSTNFQSITYSSNTASNSTANDGNTTTGPASGAIYTFTPPSTVSYAWTAPTNLVSPSNQSTATTALSTTETFTLTVSNGGCSTQATATVTVSAGAAITTDPSAAAKCAGETATFTVVATGPGLTYLWRKGGSPLSNGGNISGATLPTLTISNVSAADVDTYDVEVTATCGSPVTSAGAALTVSTPVASIDAPLTTVCSGTPVTLTENGGNATSWSWAPGGATTQAITVSPSSTTTYTVTATLNSCSATATQTITVNQTPSAVTIAPLSATICEGGSVNLVASGGQYLAPGGFNTLGAGTATTTASTTGSTLGPNPLQSYYGGAKQQMIVLASELTGLGLVNGSAISALAFNLSVAETGRVLQNLQVKISNTALNAFSSTTFAAAGTVVRNAANFTVASGWNTITFNNNFTWNGSSNILIEVNFSNNDGGGTGTSTAVYSTTTGFASTLFYRGDTETAAVIDAKTTASFSAYTQRNNMQFTFTAPTSSFVWTPATDITPTTGTSVTANPITTTTYTATSTNPNGNCASSSTVTVTVNPNYNIVASAGANGSISPSGTTTLSCDGTGDQTYTITPDACYSVADVLVDGVSVGAVTTYTFTDVTANHTIAASFVLNTYAITVSSGANGSITPATGNVNCGDNATYTITPDACYSIADVIVDGVSQGAVGTYTFTNVTAPHSISASFVLSTYTITVSAGANGSITPGTGSVNCGDNATYTITADACYSIADVIVDGVSQGAVGTYTFTNVTAAHSISASFVVNTYTITVSAGANGSITPGTGSVNCGDNATYTITPDACYHVVDVIVDGVSQGAISTYTFTNVQAAHSISATFALNAPFPAPGPLSGPINVCPYIGTGTQLTYSVPVIPGASSYAWIIPPTCTLVSGQGTNSIVLTVGAGFIANANKQIRVTALSSCGNSPQVIFYLLAQLPTTPAPIVASTSNVCPSIGTLVSITYTIPKVAAATSYNWAAQAGTTTITHTNGLGVNDTTVTVTFSAGFTTSSITVSATNDCNTSGTRSLLITRNNPATPGLVSGPTNACEFIAPGGTPATYSVANVAGNTYTWTAVPSAIGLTGQGTNSISFTFPNGFTTGSISVTATNGCGTSAVRTLSIGKLNPATPSVIDVIQTDVCPNRVYTYTLSGTPANSTSVQWTVPTSAGAVLVSGQGSNSITVSYPATAVAGAVTAQAINNCGSSVTRVSDVKLPACPPEFAGKGTTKEVSSTPSTGLNVMVSPNPTTTDFKLQVITAGKETISVRLLDLQGRTLKTTRVLPYASTNIGSDLKAGAYFLEVTQGKTVKTTRVVKF